MNFLYDLAAAFVENYAASIDDDPEMFVDFEHQMVELMEEHGRSGPGQSRVGRIENMRNKQFCGLRDDAGTVLPVRVSLQIFFFFKKNCTGYFLRCCGVWGLCKGNSDKEVPKSH